MGMEPTATPDNQQDLVTSWVMSLVTSLGLLTAEYTARAPQRDEAIAEERCTRIEGCWCTMRRICLQGG